MITYVERRDDDIAGVVLLVDFLPPALSLVLPEIPAVVVNVHAAGLKPLPKLVAPLTNDARRHDYDDRAVVQLRVSW